MTTTPRILRDQPTVLLTDTTATSRKEEMHHAI
jgi:hypothetical protein